MMDLQLSDELSKPWYKSKKIFVFLVLVSVFLGTLGLQIPLSPEYTLPAEVVGYLALGVFVGGTSLIGALGVKEAIAVSSASRRDQ